MNIRFQRLVWPLLLTTGLFGLWATQEGFGQSSPLRLYSLSLDNGTKTATATAGAATLDKTSGTITSEALTTAAGATYTLTLSNSTIATTDLVFASVSNGTNSAGIPTVSTVAPGSGTLTVVVRNAHASAALNGTIKITFLSLEQ